MATQNTPLNTAKTANTNTMANQTRNYSGLVHPDVASANNGLAGVLEESAKARINSGK